MRGQVVLAGELVRGGAGRSAGARVCHAQRWHVAEPAAAQHAARAVAGSVHRQPHGRVREGVRCARRRKLLECARLASSEAEERVQVQRDGGMASDGASQRGHAAEELVAAADVQLDLRSIVIRGEQLVQQRAAMRSTVEDPGRAAQRAERAQESQAAVDVGGRGAGRARR